jgi:hypothetical protein
MRTLNRLITSFAFVFAALIAVAFSISRSSSAAPATGTLYVAPGGGACGAPSSCYTTVQAAVDAANSGDTILIAAGVYTDVQVRPRVDRLSTGTVTQVVYISKTVNLIGGYTTTNWLTSNLTSNPTILDAQNQSRAVYITGYISPTLIGLQIMHGNAAGEHGAPYNYDGGGDIYIITATALVSGNIIMSGTAFSGGGMYLYDSVSLISTNEFRGNHSAAIWSDTSASTVKHNLIHDNHSPGGYGGGIFIAYTPVTVTNNFIISNSATQGGGIYLLVGSSVLANNLILSNTTTVDGGGVHIEFGNPTFINSVIADNRSLGHGSGVFATRGTSHFIHTTITRNSGGDGSALYLIDSASTTVHAILTDTIIVNQSVGITVTSGPTNTAILNGVLWYNNGLNFGGAGAITIINAVTGDPSFALDGYHLLSNSAAIDAGVNAGVATDIDGRTRIGRPDLGAVEYGGKVFLPLTLKNS